MSGRALTRARRRTRQARVERPWCRSREIPHFLDTPGVQLVWALGLFLKTEVSMRMNTAIGALVVSGLAMPAVAQVSDVADIRGSDQ